MLTHKGTQTIKTQRLVLRRFAPDDAALMFKNWAHDDRVTKYLLWDPHESVDVSSGKLSEWVEQYSKDNCYHWAIELDGEPVGSIGVVEIEDKHSRGTIGYCIGYDYWNKGIVTEALQAVIDYMFDNVNMNKLYAYHDVENIASGRVMEKCGMVQEGLLREDMLRRDGSYADMRLFGIMRSEWKAKRKTE